MQTSNVRVVYSTGVTLVLALKKQETTTTTSTLHFILVYHAENTSCIDSLPIRTWC